MDIITFPAIQIPWHHIPRNLDARGHVRFPKPNTSLVSILA